ncbi:hypothetical protein UACE39S_02267 [Ureibacillus acetophenoni]
MVVGVVIREIRQKKKIHSNFLYKDLLSRPAIAKFERGDSDTSVEKFLKMLDRLNITLEEFEIVYKNEENKDLIFTRSYIEAFYLRNVDLLIELANKAEHEYKLFANVKFLHYKSLILLLVDELRGTQEFYKEVHVLQEYLMKCESWGYYEITLFANSLSFYSIELIDLVYKRAKCTLLIYQKLTRYRNEVGLMLFNILEKKIKCKDIPGATYYMSELIELKVSVVDNMYMQTMITFFSAIIELINGDISKHNDILRISEMFSFLELHSKSEQCKEFYKEIIQIYNISSTNELSVV